MLSCGHFVNPCFTQRLLFIVFLRLAEEQYRFCWTFLCSLVVRFSVG